MKLTPTIQSPELRFLKAWGVLLCFLAGYLPGFSETNSHPSSIRPTAPAEGYQYVRFVAQQTTEGIHIRELTLLNGEVTYPKLPMTSREGSREASVIASETDSYGKAYLVYDQQNDATHYFRDQEDGEAAVTVQFQYPVYLTGIRISKPAWSDLLSFRVEATNDLNGEWTLLYSSPENLDNTYFGPNGNLGTFSFGTDPVAVDTTPPTTPALTVDQVTSNSLAVSWPEDTEDTILGYQVYLDGEDQGFTETAAFSPSNVLLPNTSYEVAVVAYDTEYNVSDTGTITVTTQEPPVAQRYEYLRFWITQNPADRNKLQVVELNWLMGDRTFPINALTSATGDESIEILSSNDNINAFDGPYKAFDDQFNTHWFAEEGKEVTLRFKDIAINPTGIEIIHYSFATLLGFRCEGSNDGENWTTLYEINDLSRDSFVREDDIRRGRFDFGFELPDDLDLTPPSVPSNLSAEQTTATYAQLSWDASSDEGTGTAGYQLLVNGLPWATTTEPNATVYALSPQTAYDITVIATDRLGNASAASEALTINTAALEPAIGAMAIGTGLTSSTDGVWKEGVDFAAEWASYATANPFNPVFLEEISHYKVLRFMDMISTNNNWIENWSDRRQPDDPDQSVSPNFNKEEVVITEGVAIEWMIKLCNLNGSDLWMNVPHAADDNYVTQLATLIKQYLDPSLNVYIEYSNEVWGGFAAEGYAIEQGRALGFATGDFNRYAWFEEDEYARFRYYVHRSVQIYDIFNGVFADESERVEKVLSGWSRQPDVTRVHLDALADDVINPQGLAPDHYAIAPYFGIKANVNTADALSVFREQIASTVADVEQHYAILAANDLRLPLISYEAGQHFTRAGEIINRNPAMYQAYIEYLNGLSPYLNLFTHYVHARSYARGMAWGAKEYVGQPAIEAYKYRAMKDWQAVNQDNAAVQAPLILKQPREITVAEGSGATISPTVVGEQPIRYRWYKNGTLLDGVTSAQLVLPQLPASESGNTYTFTASNAYGEATSEAITLTVVEQEKVLVSAVAQPVAVDGEAEAAWEQATAYSLENVNNGTVDDAADLSATFKTLWDDQYLYLLIDVTDDVLVPVEDADKPYNYDGVEVYIDATNDKTESYNTNDRQIIYTYQGDSLLGGSGTLSFDNAQAAQSTTATGYRVEIALAWADLNLTPTAGHYLGLDVMVADNDTPGGNREGKLAWWATEDRSWDRPANFGTALLEEGQEAVFTVGNCSFTAADFADSQEIIAVSPITYANFTRKNSSYVIGIATGIQADGHAGAWEIHNDCSVQSLRKSGLQHRTTLLPDVRGVERNRNWKYVPTSISEDGQYIYATAINEEGFTHQRGWTIAPGTTVDVRWKLGSPFYGRIFGAQGEILCDDLAVETFAGNYFVTGCNDGTDALARKGSVVGKEKTRPSTILGIYPNPATDELHIRTESEVAVTVYDTRGVAVLHQAKMNGREVLSISTLRSGVYLVKVSDAQGTQSVQRIIKR